MNPYCDFARIYDRIMAGRYVSAWWAVFTDVARRRGWRYRSVVDLAGGTGEAALRFARAGAEVSVLDRSPDMLALARKKLPGVRCSRQDLRTYRLRSRVDLAVCVYGGVNYLASAGELRSLCRRTYAALRPGGVFCFDVATPYHLRHSFGRGATVFQEQDFFSRWRHRWDAKRRAARIRVDGAELLRGRWLRLRSELHVHYAHDLPELSEVLARAGFMRIEAFGLPGGREPRERDSHWLVCARKA